MLAARLLLPPVLLALTALPSASGQSGGLQFVPVTPCRVMDTRAATGTLGGPSLAAGATRNVPIPQSACNIPSTAQAYSLNVTVAPAGPLTYLSIWPMGQTQPVVSTLNSLDGRIVANAAIVPAGASGAISVYVSNTTDAIIDINGYFAPASTSGSLSFYSATPCRVVDTRNPNGPFGGPFLAANSTRSFTIPSSSCGIPATAQAYSLNVTVVPHTGLEYLTTWPTGQSQPVVSTLNSLDGSIVANAAIVPAGTGGAVSVFVANDTDAILDVNGYFAPPGAAGAEQFFSVTPCRVTDTRAGQGFSGLFGPPSLVSHAARSFPIPTGACSIPSTAQAYSLNVTVVPPGTLTYLTAWPTGQTQPVVSTLNSPEGKVVANAALVPAGTSGAVSVFVTNLTDLILDINGYFAPASRTGACSGMSLGNNAGLNGFVPFPSSAAWNTDISNAPLDPNNSAITSASGFAGLHLHHDFSSVAGGNYGIPYVVVDSSGTPLVPIDVIDYASQSDVAKAPFPITAPIEGAPADCSGWPDAYVGDSHVLVLDRNACMLYETFNTHRCDGAWNASSETIWDMKNFEQRPWGWTSADAAGLAIFPGLVRYDEVASGAIDHAIRFTMQATKNDANGGYFVEPASHAAGVYWGVSNVMGMRIRLMASFDISGYSPANQAILTAMKKYGMILADNGGYFYFQGVPDPRWNDNDLLHLDAIHSSNFEVVQMTPAWPGWDSATAPTGAAPGIISFSVSSSVVTAGTPVTLTWETVNDSYDFIDVLGGVRGGSVTTTPTATTTYTLNATNQYGRSTAQVTVTVK